MQDLAGMALASCHRTQMTSRVVCPSMKTAGLFLFLTLVSTPNLSAQDQPAPPPTAPPEIDLNLVNLPTTQSLNRHQSYFRLTHRFVRNLGRGDFGSLLEDLFALDNGAIIGLEYRFGITGNLQTGIHRSMQSKTIQFLGKYDGWRQAGRMPVAVSVVATVEGQDNFQEDYQPAIGATISRTFAPRVALYATPMFVANTNVAEIPGDHDHDHGTTAEVDEDSGHEHTMLLGLGGRLRILPKFYVSGELAPRLAGHDPGRLAWAAVAEMRTGSGKHILSLGVTNTFGTTFGQLARGGSEDDVYLCFNIIRRF
jgi:hypothetical protein